MINKAIETSLKLYFNEIINEASEKSDFKQVSLKKEIVEDYLNAKISYPYTSRHKKSLELFKTLAERF